MHRMRDDRVTLVAAGLVAYVAETLLHEAGGHGGMCLAQGHAVTMIAPLWMRCSVVTPAMVAAGPAMNVVAAVSAGALLRWAAPQGVLAGLLLWLGFSFNALVACGYLGVGAAAGFGDWPVLFGAVAPGWAWRVPVGVIAVGGYYGCLLVAAVLFRGVAGSGIAAKARLRRWAMWPALGAAGVACLAEVAGGRAQVAPIGLALGCTLVVGFSLTSMDDAVSRPCAGACDRGWVARSWWLIGAALAIGAVFVVVIGPGVAP